MSSAFGVEEHSLGGDEAAGSEASCTGVVKRAGMRFSCAVLRVELGTGHSALASSCILINYETLLIDRIERLGK